MCRTEIVTYKGKRELLTGEYAGKSIEKGHQGALIKIVLKNVANEKGILAAQIYINETRDFRRLNFMLGEYIHFKATPETILCNCFDANNIHLFSSKSLRLLHPVFSSSTLKNLGGIK